MVVGARRIPQDRDILIAFVGGLAFAIFWGRLTFVADEVGIAALFEDRHAGASIGEFLALIALTTLSFSLHDERVLTPIDLVAIALASAAFAIPSLSATSIPTTVIGLLFFWKRDIRLSSIGQLLLALVFYEWLGRIIFDFLSPVILNIETIAVQAMLSPLGGFTRDFTTLKAANGHAIYIDNGCSAFRSVSLAALIWISLIKVQTPTLKRAQWRILAAMVAVTIVLNTARLALLAESRASSDSLDMFNYWHGGPGYGIISFAMLAAMLGIFLGGQLLSRPR
jgi:exosortase/archaeosortase family protein